MIRIKNPIPPKLPNEYQEVEYIESKSYTYNTNYINTGIYPTNNTKIELKLNAKYNNYDNWFGSSNLFQCQLNGASKLTSRWNGTEYNYSISLSSAKDFIIIQDKNKTYLNGNLIKTFTNANFNDTNVLRLLSAVTNWSGTASADRDAIAKLYYCKIWESDVLVRNFVPCYRKNDNMVGLYDLVNNVFYTNSGTGTFLMGNTVEGTARDLNIKPMIENKSIIKGYVGDKLFYEAGEYARVEYLEDTGTQYIDTGVLNSSTIKVVTEMALDGTANQQSGVTYILSSKQYRYKWGTDSDKYLYYGYGSSNYYISTPRPVLSDWYRFTMAYGEQKIENASTNAILKSSNATMSRYSSTYNILLFGMRDTNTGNVNQVTGTSRVRLFKIYDNGTLIRDFVPCIRKSDNVAGLLDKVNNVFYTNAGTGTFLTGAVVGNI